MGSSLKELFKIYKNTKEANWIKVFCIIKELNILSIERYKEEKKLFDFLKEITNNKGISFFELIYSINNLETNIAIDLQNFSPINIQNKYLEEIFKALKNRVEGKETKEIENENTFVNFAELGIIFFRELRFPYNEDLESNDVFHEALHDDNVGMIKAFLANNELNLSVRNYYNESLLHFAAKENAVEILEFFINEGFYINDLSDLDQTPLHCALYSKSFKTATRLIELGAKTNLQDNNGNTPIHIACFVQELNIIKLLIQKKVKIDLPNKSHDIPLSIAILVDNTELIEYLTNNGVNLHYYEDKIYYWIALYNSINSFNFFIQKGFPLKNSYTSEFRMNLDIHSPLHDSVYNNNLEITKLFIEHGLDVNFQSNNLSTPLHLASIVDSLEIAELLLSNKANPNIQDDKGFAPLHIAIGHENIPMIQLLLNNNANINIRSEKCSEPIFHAIHVCNIEIVKLLIDNKANITKGFIITPLHKACFMNDVAIAKLLIKNGARVDCLTIDKFSPLNIAVINNNLEMVKMLIENGASVDYKSNYTPTALQTAKHNNNKEIVDYLVSKGASTLNFTRGVYKNKISIVFTRFFRYFILAISIFLIIVIVILWVFSMAY